MFREIQGIACMLALSCADERALFCQSRQIAGCRSGGGSGNHAVVACAQAALDSFGAFPKHAKERLLLSLIDLVAQPIQQLCFGDHEFHLRDAPALRFHRYFSEPNQPLRDVIPPIGHPLPANRTQFRAKNLRSSAQEEIERSFQSRSVAENSQLSSLARVNIDRSILENLYSL